MQQFRDSFSLLQYNSNISSKYRVTKVNSGYRLFYFSFFRFFFLDSISNLHTFSAEAPFNCLLLKLSRNNIFLTLVNSHGDVLISLSSGKVGLSSSKRKTPFAIRLLVKSLVNFLVQRQISQLKFFFVQTSWLKLSKLVVSLLREENFFVHYLLFSMIREHGLGLRKRKPRRL